METTITDIIVKDIRFPTSKTLDGSDAVNVDPDYSAAYVILKTNRGLEGHGLTFTTGRGTEVVVAAVKALSYLVKNITLENITDDMRGFWRKLTGDSQLRWLGPEKGVIHLATAALVNAVWDLYAKSKNKPLWKLLADMSPEELIRCIDFSYIDDAITPEEALEILKSKEEGKKQREQSILKTGYPAYTTSAGWLGYDDQKIRRLAEQAMDQGWTAVKMKVGANLDDDIRRAGILRDTIGDNNHLMMDANQKWGVPEAIRYMDNLKEFKPWWIEEPTSPDDILGHATIARSIAPIKVATGEHCQNRVMFKQLMQAEAIHFCQIDSCRLGGVNEVLAILLMAEKFNIPVCPHGGGVGLCEYIQHLSIFDFIAVSGSLENRILEYVDHLHEHFIDPVQIREGRYQVPGQPGYSITMKEGSLRDYAFPEGMVWSK